jgi:hypothetical protein
MMLPAAAYSADVAAAQAGSFWVFGGGDYSQPGYFLCFFLAAFAGFGVGFGFGLAFGAA